MNEDKDKTQEQQKKNNSTENNDNTFIPNNENNPIIKEVNELLMDQEQVLKKVLIHNKDYIELEISVPESLTQSQFPIKFLLKISMNFPKEEPELYCITKFSYPHIYDGRNLLKDVLKKKWNNNIHSLDIIINRIPRFIIEFNNSLEDGYLLLVGKYMLDHLYSLDRIKELPIFHQNVKQNEKIKNKIVKKNKILTISDLSFCLYEIESKNFAKLTFYENLNNLVTFKRNTQENTITFIWKNTNKGKENETIDIEIATNETEKIKSILLEKMELFGKEYNVSQKVIKKRMGKLPCNDIEGVEKKIENLEKEFNDKKNINMDSVHKLMTLYQTAVEYYSAINSPQFQIFTEKIKKMMADPQINELIDKNKNLNQNKDLSTLKDNQNINKDKKNEKEEKILTQGLNKISKLIPFSGNKGQKKVTKPKVSISKEDEDGGTLDVGSDDDEEEEEEEEEKEKEKENKDKKEEKNEKEEIKNNDNKEDKKEEDKKENIES